MSFMTPWTSGSLAGPRPGKIAFFFETSGLQFFDGIIAIEIDARAIAAVVCRKSVDVETGD